MGEGTTITGGAGYGYGSTYSGTGGAGGCGGTPPGKPETLRDHGLAKVVMATLGDNGELTVIVRILRPEDVRRIIADLNDSSAG
jgi:hypothetical protein